MINEKDVFDVLLAVERTNADNIGTKVTCAKIRELVKKLIDRRLDDMADEHEAEVMAGYYAKKKKQGISKDYILQQIARDKELLSFVFNKEV
jgi:hypothetical protein